MGCACGVEWHGGPPPSPPSPPLAPNPHAGIGLLSRAAVHHMAAVPQLAAGDRSSSLAAAAEFRQMVAQLHEQGIEVLLQASPWPAMPCDGLARLRGGRCGAGVFLSVVRTLGPRQQHSPPAARAARPLPCFLPPSAIPPQVDLTFTAEGTDAHPSTLSLRGLDYGTYYRKNGVRGRRGGQGRTEVGGRGGGACSGLCQTQRAQRLQRRQRPGFRRGGQRLDSGRRQGSRVGRA